MNKAEILKAIADEPELPGKMSGAVRKAILLAFEESETSGINFVTESLRIAVRSTKNGITERIERLMHPTPGRTKNE